MGSFAVRLWLNTKRRDQLVAAAYRKAGAKELEKIDPMKVMLATLEKAKYFTDVTEEVFVQILSPSNIEEMSAFDGGRQSSPMEQEVCLFQEFSGILLPKVREFIKTTPEITFKLMPTTFLECVPFIEAARRFCEDRPALQEARKKIAEIDDAAYSLLADGRFEKIGDKCPPIAGFYRVPKVSVRPLVELSTPGPPKVSGC